MILDYLFIVAACLECSMGIFGDTDMVLYGSRYILWIFFFIYCIRLFRTSFTKSEKIVLVVLIVLGVINYAVSGINAGLKGVIFLFAIKEIDKKLLLKSLGISIGLAMGIICIWACLFPRQATWSIEVGGRGLNGIRYTLGFKHSNRFMAAAFQIVIILLCLSDRKRWLAVILSAAMIAFFYYFTETRTVMAATCAVLLLYILGGLLHYPAVGRIVASVSIMGMGAELLLSLLTACKVDSVFMFAIDQFITGRMGQVYRESFLGNYASGYIGNWHLFSNLQNQAGFDMGFVFIFYYYGIIFGSLFILLITYTIVALWKRQDWMKYPLLFGMCTLTFMEIFYFSNSISKNLLLIFCGLMIWEYRREKTAISHSSLSTQ